jgi:hypothetical protein
MKHVDEWDVIGTRPKPKPADFGPLFSDPEPEPPVPEPAAPAPDPEPEIPAAVDEVPLDPRKPEPPTKAERLEAIERAKREVVDALCQRAKARLGLPIADAGVTADDVWELAQRIPAAALLGSEGRAWSWTGAWLLTLARAGRLSPFMVEGIPVTRRATTRDASHGNAHRVYLHPDDPRAIGGARSQRPDA